MLKQKRRDKEALKLKNRHVSPKARYQSVGCSVASASKMKDKGKAKAPPIEVVDLTGDDD
jgi:hypothetical protein